MLDENLSWASRRGPGNSAEQVKDWSAREVPDGFLWVARSQGSSPQPR